MILNNKIAISMHIKNSKSREIKAPHQLLEIIINKKKLKHKKMFKITNINRKAI
jgi:hypothetical protein